MRKVLLVLALLLGIVSAAACDGGDAAVRFGTAETGVGIAAGVAVGLHGCDQAAAGWMKMISGRDYDTFTSRGMQGLGVPRDAANIVDAGISIASSMGIAAAEQAARIEVAQLARQINTAERVGSALKPDATHRAASFLSEDQLKSGSFFKIVGGDNVERKLLQTKGAMNGETGIFEYIVNPTGEITHQRFISGGRITGYPNQ